MAANRYRPPLYLASLEEEQGRTLECIPLKGHKFSEAWLQERLFNHPEILPFGEIDPSFETAIPLCMELETDAGNIDVVYASPAGHIALVECKLWRNPQARREVIGQILDYAKELAAWNYERLSQAVGDAAERSADTLYAIAAKKEQGLDEAAFVDAVTRNLREGRFLLAIIGDGIREEVESITAFLQSHAGIRFSFALVEMAVYRMPAEPGGFLIQPRVLARTVEIERFIVRLDGEGIAPVEVVSGNGTKQTGTSPKLSLKEICSQLEFVKPGLGVDVAEFVERCEDLGIVRGRGAKLSLSLRYREDLFGKKRRFEFCKIGPSTGKLDTSYVCDFARKAGDISIGEEYLANLAKLIPGSRVSEGEIWKAVVDADGEYPSVATVLQRSDEWLTLIDKTLDRFKELLKELRQRKEEAPD